MQFGPNEDFAHYPRTPTRGRDACWPRPAATSCSCPRSARSIRTAPTRRRASRCRASPASSAASSAPDISRACHHRRQAVPHRGAGRRDFRREGFPAAHRHPPHGRRPVPAGGDRRRTDGARGRRPGDELAQPVPDQPGARAGAGYLRQLQAAGRRLHGGRCAISRSIERAGRRALEAAGFRPDYFACATRGPGAPQPGTRATSWC